MSYGTNNKYISVSNIITYYNHLDRLNAIESFNDCLTKHRGHPATIQDIIGEDASIKAYAKSTIIYFAYYDEMISVKHIPSLKNRLSNSKSCAPYPQFTTNKHVIISFARGVILQNNTGYISMVYTNEHYRRQGYATSMLNIMINQYNNNIEWSLDVKANNMAAIYCYKKVGFIIVKTYIDHNTSLNLMVRKVG